MKNLMIVLAIIGAVYLAAKIAKRIFNISGASDTGKAIDTILG